MPELPEVETIRIYLHKTIVGKTITNIEVLNPKSFTGTIANCIGKKIIDTGRLGKVLSLKLEDNTWLSVHLKMSGQLLLNLPQPVTSTRVIFSFSDQTKLFFNDSRKFGWIRHSAKQEGTTAPDVTRKEFTLDYFSKMVKKTRKPIKTLLLDQDRIAGIGNIYANDALFIAKIYPYRESNSLSDLEIKDLYKAVIDIIAEGLRYRGTSASPVYRSPDGAKGSYQDHFKVYAREGLPCLVCNTPIVREKVGGRSSFYCPHCQT